MGGEKERTTRGRGKRNSKQNILYGKQSIFNKRKSAYCSLRSHALPSWAITVSRKEYRSPQMYLFERLIKKAGIIYDDV